MKELQTTNKSLVVKKVSYPQKHISAAAKHLGNGIPWSRIQKACKDIEECAVILKVGIVPFSFVMGTIFDSVCQSILLKGPHNPPLTYCLEFFYHPMAILGALLCAGVSLAALHSTRPIKSTMTLEEFIKLLPEEEATSLSVKITSIENMKKLKEEYGAGAEAFLEKYVGTSNTSMLTVLKLMVQQDEKNILAIINPESQEHLILKNTKEPILELSHKV